MQMNSNGYMKPDLNNEDIVGFRVFRSEVQKDKFNVYAVDNKGNPLVAFLVDTEHTTALDVCSTLNAPYEEELPDIVQHRTEEVRMPDGSVKYYQVQG